MSKGITTYFRFSVFGSVTKQLLSEPKKLISTNSESIEDKISCK